MADARPWHGVDHAENFPVGSWLMPARIRPAVLAIYRFARHADDIADEGNSPADARDQGLLALDAALHVARGGQSSGEAVVDGLIEPSARFGLDWQHFHDLLDAFRQDLRVKRYDDDAAVLDYCRRSANPVGRLMLQLFDADTPLNRQHSDAICSALQRINFLQDIGIDADKDRVYLPLNVLRAAGVDDARFLSEARSGRLGERCREAVRQNWGVVRRQLLSGCSLPGQLPGRLSAELRFIISGGHRILDRIAAADYDSVARRPKLGWADAPALLHRAIRLPREDDPV